MDTLDLFTIIILVIALIGCLYLYIMRVNLDDSALTHLSGHNDDPYMPIIPQIIPQQQLIDQGFIPISQQLPIIQQPIQLTDAGIDALRAFALECALYEHAQKAQKEAKEKQPARFLELGDL